MKSPGLAVICFVLLHAGAHGFGILPGVSLSHQEITEQAILNATLQTCRDLAQDEGSDFSFPTQPFTAGAVAAACGASQSSKTFRQAITCIKLRTSRVDIRYPFQSSFHFDKEMFTEGRRIITEGLTAVKASNKKENYEAAREQLGEILHPLQDFYSHSNWVELGNTRPNSNLIRAGSSIGNTADASRATCRSCDNDVCINNILEDITAEQILTSGYTGLFPFVSTKPKGKCSHGGATDFSSKLEPTGGINKDTFTSNHGFLHSQAANLAIAASSELLEDIRLAAGDRTFLRMVGIFKGSSRALCFVTDTTKSMSDDIEVVKTVTSSIIISHLGAKNEPSVYILVPFNDPGFGPLIKTTNATVFKSTINSLTASGGGDDQEMSLSALQLALTSAPFNSEIFLFTDAPAKDKYLKNTVIALIERTQSVVNFMITDSTATNRRRKRSNANQPQVRMIADSDAQLYRELAQASGGQAIEVTTSELQAATAVITQSMNSSLVTLLQAARSPGTADNFTFLVDETVINLIVYITGRSVTFTLISPTGASQESTDSAGSLITATQSLGNFITLQLKNQVGQWEIRMMSTNPYTLRVMGQSPIDFLFHFVEPSQDPFIGFDALDTRPRAGLSGSLLVSLTGSDSATVTEVALIVSSGSEEIKGVVVPQGSGNFLVQVDMIPSVEFVVRVKGSNQDSSNIFQRQSLTKFRGSNLKITADSDSILIPGTPFSVPFTVMTNGTGGNLTLRVTNSRGFESTSPTILFLGSGNSTNGTVVMSAPLNTPSGTDVMLTIEAESPEGSDTNYIVLLFSVLNKVTDFTPPQCQLLNIQSNCTENCSLSTWEISVRVTDGDAGTGVDRVSLRQGNRTLNTSLVAGNENKVLVSYAVSCCLPDVELLVVDGVGNVGSCIFNARDTLSAAVSVSTNQYLFLYLTVLILGLMLTEVRTD
ncbi:von Willebrand factor A domain-containing protein 7-like [Nematolebias whitei]|uniref:von Willebrand factor A domain-containing protein 7-like n=1 Tax=Nematolebias whitei TaxID=451745 RepID=UPI001898AB9F|nr:von Willebrand factor A domain-containing protein 7-like [Nematolebias whitei]